MVPIRVRHPLSLIIRGGIALAEIREVISQLPWAADVVVGSGWSWRVEYTSAGFGACRLWGQVGGWTPETAGWDFRCPPGSGYNNLMQFNVIGNEKNFSFNADQKYSLMGGNITLSQAPKNQYQPHVFSFNTGPVVSFYGLSGTYSPPGLSFGDFTSRSPSSPVVTCTRNADALVLTLDTTEINFGTVPSASTALIKKNLTWRATGSGLAGIWTLTFDSPSRAGNDILLGGAKISVLDSSTIIPLGSPVNIAGTSGSYTLQLDPTTANAFDPVETNLSITLTAN